eukprot:TRINITY_DN4311_c0_g1_i1.p1 TRINITY_DN4311_c0_g1~~TRINITY_DN4311_c0_g1_i1.p1  ORF type:complete len:106 (-),score=4.51 TRINITY_DN4311_c0_g1_i1:144-461(-)
MGQILVTQRAMPRPTNKVISQSATIMVADVLFPSSTGRLFLEIHTSAPLPHSPKAGKTLRMMRTSGWETIVQPLLRPGAVLSVMYCPDTLLIHTLQHRSPLSNSR